MYHTNGMHMIGLGLRNLSKCLYQLYLTTFSLGLSLMLIVLCNCIGEYVDMFKFQSITDSL